VIGTDKRRRVHAAATGRPEYVNGWKNRTEAMLTIKQMRYLVAIADQLHFRRAAEIMHVSQPTISGQLRDMELKLGAQLVERSRSNVLMTPLGKEIVDRARIILAEIEEINDLAMRGQGSLSGTFRLGILSTLGPYLLPHILPSLHEKYPDLRLYIREGMPDAQVQDLEDEIAGLETRLSNLKEEVGNLEKAVTQKNNEIVDAQGLIKKYEDQQKNVRNNREFDSLSKEIEYQNLEIELCNKKIREFNVQIEEKRTVITESDTSLGERKSDLDNKKKELDEIVTDTKKEEEGLYKKSEKIEILIEERLLTAYKRIRSNARNGLAVVSIQRDACGGCFNQIPPQRQLDIKSRKKIIVCEYCGRILVDDEIIQESYL